ncbi:MAG TPA: tRNA-modifying protein YgfZ, partial [Mariprofundaceae bacterium]|nr:tRNA-modifying protein YgfZ [Mariprofundaceae bacterium]
LNANLIEFNGVSFEKGCYVGQEITSRMHWRGGIKKKLYRVGIEEQPDSLPCPLFTTAKIGELKSAAIDHEGACTGIALLPVEVAESKAPLTLENGSIVTLHEACHA